MISAVVIARDEQKNIAKCLKSISWCDEILLIDDYSKDKTVDIARKLKARVYKRRLNKDFSKQRNYGLKKANGEWVLFVDADEFVSKDLAREIVKEIEKLKVADGYFIKRVGLFEESLLRLGKKGSGFWSRSVHETWKINGKLGKLNSPLFHSYPVSLREYIKKINFYTNLHAECNIKEGKKATFLKIILYSTLKFFENFFLKKGFKKGEKGFVYSMFASFHSFLSWVKIWTY